MDKEKFRSVTFYVLQCLAGFGIGYALYKNFPQHQFFWSMISVLLVLSPDNSSNKLALDRMKANFLGSIAGLITFAIPLPEAISICLGIIVVITAGYLFKLENAIRSALAALIIVTLHDKTGGTWNVALERMICVMVGCAIGLFITLIFNFFIRLTDKREIADSGGE